MRTSLKLSAFVGVGAVALASVAFACTRIVYTGLDGLVVTGRSMDWKDEIPGNLWVLPRGIERNGLAGPNSVKWTAQYGSVVTTSFDIASVDGVNERGLAGNLLWLTPSKYPVYDGRRPGLAISLWLQYQLDNFATVADAVAALRPEPFAVVSSEIPGTDRFTTVHLSLSDAKGDSAVFEYRDGKLTIFHSKDYRVMTNEPFFDQQLALLAYWQKVDGFTMLPGTNRAEDRFVRANFYLSKVPQTADARVGVAQVLSIVRNCSVPLGITTQEANLSQTRWRTAVDHKNLRYYYESTLSPNVFWVDLNKLDFRKGAPVKKLTVGDIYTYAGDTSGEFKPTKPFEFAPLPPERIREIERTLRDGN